MLRPVALKRLTVLFLSARSEVRCLGRGVVLVANVWLVAQSFELVVTALLSMLHTSKKLREAIGKGGLFISELSLRCVAA